MLRDERWQLVISGTQGGGLFKVAGSTICVENEQKFAPALTVLKLTGATDRSDLASGLSRFAYEG
jgi:hypothetical protein